LRISPGWRGGEVLLLIGYRIPPRARCAATSLEQRATIPYNGMQDMQMSLIVELSAIAGDLRVVENSIRTIEHGRGCSMPTVLFGRSVDHG
jgi:hypothetical protein